MSQNQNDVQFQQQVNDPLDNNIKVACRVRPMLNTDSGNVCVQVQQNACFIANENNQQKFSFDRVFNPEATQEEVFDEVRVNTIDPFLHGINGTIFSYGATCSGKSYTIFGPDELEYGIIPRTIQYIFDYFTEAQNNGIQYFLSVSFLELYLERVRDLLDMTNKNLQVFDSETNPVPDATEIQINSIAQITEVIELANAFKVMAPNKINQQSSRSHCILILNVLARNQQNGTFRLSKLFLADLAGSEKISRTEAQGLRLKEAKNINKSLLALGKVVNSLTAQQTSHVPYRDSKLTRLLKCSLGGNSKTYLIIHISPTEDAIQESLSTLLFASRAKSVKNTVEMNAYFDGISDARLADELVKAREVIKLLYYKKYVPQKTIDFYINKQSDSEFLFKLSKDNIYLKEQATINSAISFSQQENRTDQVDFSEPGSASQYIPHIFSLEQQLSNGQNIQLTIEQFNQLKQDSELLNQICNNDNNSQQEHYGVHDICSQQENIFSILKLQNVQLLKEKISTLNLEETNQDGFSCITYAAQIKFFTAIKPIIQQGMDCLVRDDNGDLVIHILLENTGHCVSSILQSQYIETLDFIINNMEGQYNQQDAGCRYPIQILLQNTDQTEFKQQILKILLKYNFCIFMDDSTEFVDQKWFSLLDCVYNKDQKSLELLLAHVIQKQINTTFLEQTGAFRAFHLTIKLQNKILFLIFIRTQQLQKLFINCQFQNISALELSFQVQNIDCFEYLIKAGADIQQDLLNKVFILGDLAFCQIVVQHCDFQKYNFDQLLTSALSQGNIQLLELILQKQNYTFDSQVLALVHQIHGEQSQFYQFVQQLCQNKIKEAESPTVKSSINSAILNHEQQLAQLENILNNLNTNANIQQQFSQLSNIYFNQQYEKQILPKSRVNYIEYLYLNKSKFSLSAIKEIIFVLGVKNLDLTKILQICKQSKDFQWLGILQQK